VHIVRAGAGPRLLLVHGSAADHTTWSAQLASPTLRARCELVAYDRADAGSVAAHAADAAAFAPEIVVGSSFGAVVALELARDQAAATLSRPLDRSPQAPARLAPRGVVLIEPPMRASDAADPAHDTFLAAFDAELAARGGAAAGELFLRTTIGDVAFERMPKPTRERAIARWAQIRADSAALVAYAPRYAELSRVTAPILLVGGDRSAPYFRPTLAALAAALPRARLANISGGHMLHAENPRAFNELVASFVDEVLGCRP
jgi:pimeloyl-ACP methyl ester carboxylesterase